MDVNKSPDDNNGGGQREKVKRVSQVSVTLHTPSSIGKARLLESEES